MLSGVGVVVVADMLVLVAVEKRARASCAVANEETKEEDLAVVESRDEAHQSKDTLLENMVIALGWSCCGCGSSRCNMQHIF
jgi:hypothetical protein